MDSDLYNSIICEYLIPFAVSVYGIRNFYLHQDNDPKHSSKLCSELLRKNSICWVKLKQYLIYFLFIFYLFYFIFIYYNKD